MKVKIWYQVFSEYVFCRIFNENRFKSKAFVKRTLLSVLAIMMCAGFVSAQGQLAFPGAEGFGKFTKGGRGGKVLYVTNLNDSGSGSFREAIDASGPRIVVFKVGGTITLKSQILINNPNITIAGQTAPGEGILIKGGSVKIKASEVIVRNVRFRIGSIISDDAITIASNGSELNNIIIDHCSVSWSSDENIGINGRNGGLKNVTVQNCIIGEGLKNHSMGLLVNKIMDGIGPDRVSVHKNLFVSNQERNPMVGNEISCTVINNLVHNWKTKGSEYHRGSYGDVLYNNFKVGGDTQAAHRAIEISDVGVVEVSSIYLKGNVVPSGIDVVNGDDSNLKSSPHFSNSDYGFAPITNIGQVESHVLGNAGAFPRDAVDNRLINEYKSGKGKTIYDESEVGGYPTIKGGTAPKDSDADGMPDEWELANGLNPNVADDAADKNGDGYSNIENYVNCLIIGDCSSAPVANTAPVISTIAEQVIDQDASTEAIAFTVSDKESDASSLSVSATSGNTSLVENKGIELAGSGSDRTIQIMPLAGASGTASIKVTVSDGITSTSTSFDLVVRAKVAGNIAPKISDINDQIIFKNESSPVIKFTVSDSESSAADLSVTAASGNGELVEDSGILLGGTGTERTITVTPKLETIGTASITVTVSDGEDKSSTSFTIKVEDEAAKPANSAPIIKNPGDQQYLENASVSLKIEATDPDVGDKILFSATGLPTSLTINSTTGVIEGKLINVGEYNVKVKATDPEGLADEESFMLAVSVAPVASSAFLLVNSGGGAVTFQEESWKSDQYAKGGQTYSNTIDISGTENDKIYQTERYGAYSYEIPLKDGIYDIKLHFAEIYFGVKKDGGVGSRVFNVNVENGQGSLQNYDIIKRAGGAAIAVVEKLSGVKVADGNMTITFSAIKDNPKISGIEIISIEDLANSAPIVTNPGDQEYLKDAAVSLQIEAKDPDVGDKILFSATGLPTSLVINSTTGIIEGQLNNTGNFNVKVKATDQDGLSDEESFILTVSGPPVVSPALLLINSGGGAVTFKEENWESDQYAKGGQTYSYNVPISGTENDKIYQTERYGAYSYEIPLKNGTYDIKLHFAEIYFGVKKAGGIGSRIFDVDLEGGQRALTNYDIFKSAGGSATAVVEDMPNINVTDGFLSISLSAIKDNPKISAIEIILNSEEQNPEIVSTNISVYPNPFEDSFLLDLGVQEMNNDIKLIIYNGMGREIYSEIIPAELSTTRYEVDLSNIEMESGNIYYLRTIEEGTAIKKFTRIIKK